MAARSGTWRVESRQRMISVQVACHVRCADRACRGLDFDVHVLDFGPVGGSLRLGVGRDPTGTLGYGMLSEVVRQIFASKYSSNFRR
jgi:hypothetical protein